jgi:putative transposase
VIRASRQAGDPLRRLPIEVACSVLGVNRGSYYRPDPLASPRLLTPEVTLREAIEQVVLEFAGYGYRRVTEQLRRQGRQVNRKRVLRLMREACLLCQLKRRWTRTTDSEHGLKVYPNLLAAPRGHPGWRSLIGLDQAWVADLTYIRLPRGFCYLAAILEAFSRRVVGWHLSERIDAELAVAALEVALKSRKPAAGWVHHSDRGVRVPACGRSPAATTWRGWRRREQGSAWQRREHRGRTRRRRASCARSSTRRSISPNTKTTSRPSKR